MAAAQQGLPDNAAHGYAIETSGGRVGMGSADWESTASMASRGPEAAGTALSASLEATATAEALGSLEATATAEALGPLEAKAMAEAKVMAAVVFLLYFFYPQMCSQLFAAVSCRSVEGKLYLTVDLEEQCWHGRQSAADKVDTILPLLFAQSSAEEDETTAPACLHVHSTSVVCACHSSLYILFDVL